MKFSLIIGIVYSLCLAMLIYLIIDSININNKSEFFNDFEKKLSDNSLYFEYENFITDDDCDMLINMSKDNLKPSLVYSASTDSNDNNTRKSDQMWLKPNANDLTKKISNIVSTMSGMPLENLEDIQVVRYEEGGFFNPHYDACDGDIEFCKRMDGASGARYMTFLIYLNDNFEGGETVFPKLSKNIIPKKGKVLIFYNIDSDGILIKDSLHGGNPVKEGIKWICNVWVRQKKFVG